MGGRTGHSPGLEAFAPSHRNTAGSASMQESEFTDNSFPFLMRSGVLVLGFFQSTEPVLQATCWPESWEAKAVFPSLHTDFLEETGMSCSTSGQVGSSGTRKTGIRATQF